MTTSWPLHVRVALALGWKDPEPFEADGIVDYDTWVAEDPSGRVTFVPDYDTDWAAIGPVIERERLALWTSGPLGQLLDADKHDLWRCNGPENGMQLEGSTVGETAPLAVCYHVLACRAAA